MTAPATRSPGGAMPETRAAGAGRRRRIEPKADVEDLEIALLTRAIAAARGIDFREFDQDLLRDRVRACRQSEGAKTISGLIERGLHTTACMDRLVEGLLDTRSAFFAPPEAYRTLCEGVLPALRTYPYVRIWHAGCGTGQEVYSLLPLLFEAGLLDRCRVYATDLSERALDVARAGSYPRAEVDLAEDAYRLAGGRAALSDYVSAARASATFKPFLKEHLVFCRHNLATDQSFNEFNLVMCRNVLGGFGWALQERACGLIAASLGRLGLLLLGPDESPVPSGGAFEPAHAAAGIFRRTR